MWSTLFQADSGRMLHQAQWFSRKSETAIFRHKTRLRSLEESYPMLPIALTTAPTPSCLLLLGPKFERRESFLTETFL